MTDSIPNALYHVTTIKRLDKWRREGFWPGPVRAWVSIAAAERFSKQTGRRVIVRLTRRGAWYPMDGHRGEAVWTSRAVPFSEVLQ